jgi:hypothetical protein
MSTLDWIGKKAVLNYHREVPYHILKCPIWCECPFACLRHLFKVIDKR